MGTSEAAADATTLVFRYVISSTEMRHIERAERCVYLTLGSAGRLRLRGEIPGCGETCHADLATLLPEYAMSFEGPSDPALWPSACRAFAGSVSEAIASALAVNHPIAAVEARGRLALEVLVASLRAPDDLPQTSDEGTMTCPLCVAAASGGRLRVSAMAHDLFRQLCQACVGAVASGWTVAFEDDLHRPGHSLRVSLRAQASP